jgi:hypothetical protein
LFGEPTYSFDHQGVHFVVLNSILEECPPREKAVVSSYKNGVSGRRVRM